MALKKRWKTDNTVFWAEGLTPPITPKKLVVECETNVKATASINYMQFSKQKSKKISVL